MLRPQGRLPSDEGVAEERPGITLQGVSRTFDGGADTVWAVREVDLDVAAGELVCLFGSSGSGKSTLLNLIAGLDLPTAGQVHVGSAEVSAMTVDQRSRLRQRDVGTVFQDHNLIEEFTALENVALPLEIVGTPFGEAVGPAEERLAQVGLAGLGQRFPHQLSGGQRQRVGIARALVGSRSVLLADEPTGALDSVNSRALFELLRQVAGAGTTVVVATHELMARDFADHVYEISDGRVSAVPGS